MFVYHDKNKIYNMHWGLGEGIGWMGLGQVVGVGGGGWVSHG